MAKYAVKVREILERTVIVDPGENGAFEDAVDIVSDAYNNCDIVLDAEDMCGRAEIGASETFGENPIADDDERLEIFSKYPSEED